MDRQMDREINGNKWTYLQETTVYFLSPSVSVTFPYASQDNLKKILSMIVVVFTVANFTEVATLTPITFQVIILAQTMIFP